MVNQFQCRQCPHTHFVVTNKAHLIRSQLCGSCYEKTQILKRGGYNAKKCKQIHSRKS